MPTDNSSGSILDLTCRSPTSTTPLKKSLVASLPVSAMLLLPTAYKVAPDCQNYFEDMYAIEALLCNQLISSPRISGGL